MSNERKLVAVEPLPSLVCGDCIHCQPGPNTQNDVLSRVCYRFPPVPMLVGTNQGPAVMSVRAEIRVDTPACGEWEEPDEVAPPVSPGLTS